MKIDISFMANELIFYQTIIIEDESLSKEDLIKGLRNKSILTTTWFDKNNPNSNEVLGEGMSRIGYVEKQEVEESDYEYFNLI